VLRVIDGALVPNAAYGDAVGCHERHELQRDDGVEGHGAAEVDEREEAAYGAGKEHRVCGHCLVCKLCIEKVLLAAFFF